MPPSTNYSMFLRAVGLKQGFRRSSSQSLVHIIVAAGVGALSGVYIFREPLEEYGQYLKEKQVSEQATSSAPTTQPTETSRP
mmetsp:Transcript_33687/g.70044  ORF Transcript_33687/g.70044 Transcript_33687/m.70044 type:complete len:82 (+) Transcript_33687:192-437(+)